jgi:hypothetical protein
MAFYDKNTEIKTVIKNIHLANLNYRRNGNPDRWWWICLPAA